MKRMSWTVGQTDITKIPRQVLNIIFCALPALWHGKFSADTLSAYNFFKEMSYKSLKVHKAMPKRIVNMY